MQYIKLVNEGVGGQNPINVVYEWPLKSTEDQKVLRISKETTGCDIHFMVELLFFKNASTRSGSSTIWDKSFPYVTIKNNNTVEKPS